MASILMDAMVLYQIFDLLITTRQRAASANLPRLMPTWPHARIEHSTLATAAPSNSSPSKPNSLSYRKILVTEMDTEVYHSGTCPRSYRSQHKEIS
jgi:hypothetical protein